MKQHAIQLTPTSNFLQYACSIVSVGLFCFGYLICDFIFPGVSDEQYIPKTPEEVLACNFWLLRMNLYSVLIGILFFNSKRMSTINGVIFIWSFGLYMSGSDIIDRLLFNVRSFQVNDIIAIVITLIICYYEYRKRQRGASPSKVSC